MTRLQDVRLYSVGEKLDLESSVDFRVVLDNLRRRWWVIAVSVVVVCGIVFVQETRLQMNPSGQVLVERTYETRSKSQVLGLVRIDTASITPSPNLASQLAILNSDMTRTRLQKQLKTTSVVEVSRSEPRFTITDGVDEENNAVSFLTSGIPSTSFRCVGESKQSCSVLIDAYVDLTVDLQEAAISEGLRNGVILIDELVQSLKSRLTAEGIDRGLDESLRTEIAGLTTKRDALSTLLSAPLSNFVLISEDSRILGKSVSSMTPSTYGFALIVGLVAGLLVVIQLATMDRTIRHSWQVRRTAPELALIGSPVPRDNRTQATALAAAIDRASLNGFTHLLIAPLDPSLGSFVELSLSKSQSMLDVTIVDKETVTVEQLVKSAKQITVIVVKIGQTKCDELVEVIGLATSGGSYLGGVVLVA